MTRKKFFSKEARENRFSDRADGNIVSFMLLMPFIFFLLLSAVDVGMYFQNVNNIRNVSQDTAQNAASVAGVGNINTITRLEDNFGIGSQASSSPITSGMLQAGHPSLEGVTLRNTYEYLLAERLVNNDSLYRVRIHDLVCAVDSGWRGAIGDNGWWVHHIDDRVYCRTEWTYEGMPLSLFSVFVGDTPRMTAGNVPAETVIAPVDHANRGSSDINPGSVSDYTVGRPN